MQYALKFLKQYTFTFPNGDAATLTPAQIAALRAVAERWNLTERVEVSPMFGGDGAIVVNVGSMWLAIETDGYTHS
jgi:hypothetical protein